MIFKTKKLVGNKHSTKLKVLAIAIKKVINYPMRASEITLNNYFLINYKKSLKEICLEIIKNCNVKLLDNQLLIIPKNYKDNKLATFITYGNRTSRGSFILKTAFNQ